MADKWQPANLGQYWLRCQSTQLTQLGFHQENTSSKLNLKKKNIERNKRKLSNTFPNPLRTVKFIGI